MARCGRSPILGVSWLTLGAQVCRLSCCPQPPVSGVGQVPNHTTR